MGLIKSRIIYLIFLQILMISFTGVYKFLSRCPIFRMRNFTCAPDWARKKMGAQNQLHVDGNTTRNIAFCSLLPKYHLQPSFLMSKSFHNEAFVVLSVALTSKIRCFSKNNFHNTNVSVYRCSEEYVESMRFY